MTNMRDRTLLFCSAGSQFEETARALRVCRAALVPDRAVLADELQATWAQGLHRCFVYVRDHSPVEEPNAVGASLEHALWEIMMNHGGPAGLIWDGNRQLFGWKYKRIEPALVAHTVNRWMETEGLQRGAYEVFWDFLRPDNMAWALEVINLIDYPVVANGKAASHGDPRYSLALVGALSGCFHEKGNLWLGSNSLVELAGLVKRPTEIFDSYAAGQLRREALMDFALAHEDGYWSPLRMTNDGGILWSDGPTIDPVSYIWNAQRGVNPDEPNPVLGGS